MLLTWVFGALGLVGVYGLSVPSDAALERRQGTDCIPRDPIENIAERINVLLAPPTAAGLSIKLCPNTEYPITSPLIFAQPNQEIITLGFPSPDANLTTRAIIKVSGPIVNGEGHTVAVDGTCASCDGIAIRYVQIDGNRFEGQPPTKGGGNIEIGGDNQGQVVEGVHSSLPRSWSCLHIVEGTLSCARALIQNNDIGPCGTDTYGQWADGISLSCRDSVVRNNQITGATDGGIVIFGSPGSRIYNNTISCVGNTLLGGINLVDYNPWNGDFGDVIVENNIINGGFATNVSAPGQASPDDPPGPLEVGWNNETAFIKIGVAMGPRTWFGDIFGMNFTRGATVRNNLFQGAFGYAMAAATVQNFTIEGNVIGEDTTFIGSVGPNCSTTDIVPDPSAFVMNSTQILGSSLQTGFQDRDSDSLICIMPDNGDFWPWAPGKSPEDTKVVDNTTNSDGNSTNTEDNQAGTGDRNNTSGSSSSSNNTVGLAVGLTIGIIAALVLACFFRAWYMKRTRQNRQLY